MGREGEVTLSIPVAFQSPLDFYEYDTDSSEFCAVVPKK